MNCVLLRVTQEDGWVKNGTRQPLININGTHVQVTDALDERELIVHVWWGCGCVNPVTQNMLWTILTAVEVNADFGA